ncbi:helix-turn-helix transcriptional regulator [Clostridium sp. 19966]|uniref:helix-turn-helix domain-containing protein n=1 Tax=Clostridium sp. 19966 TaxID=2768166 RepID=UPI0028DE344F|nr:helix-turn-helix domain-containing protein [Clostridium sp. 19966]MDT8718234.1 helix-turn-helix transcriptional regulator [Clostridium sp. 19966]
MERSEYYEYIAALKDLTTYHYKIWMLLKGKSYSQSQISKILYVDPQRINRAMKDLLKRGIVSVDRIEGRNKFFRLTDIDKIVREGINNEDN